MSFWEYQYFLNNTIIEDVNGYWYIKKHSGNAGLISAGMELLGSCTHSVSIPVGWKSRELLKVPWAKVVFHHKICAISDIVGDVQ